MSATKQVGTPEDKLIVHVFYGWYLARGYTPRAAEIKARYQATKWEG